MLRIIAILANIALFGTALFLFYRNGIPKGGDVWIAYVVLVTPAVTLIYLAIGLRFRSESRLSRLVKLWFDAKEAELKARAKISE